MAQILYPQNEQIIQVTIVDVNGVPVNDATVNATLLDQNSTPVPPINNVNLVNIDTKGNYAYTVLAGSFNPEPIPGYVLNIVVSLASVVKIDTFEPVAVVTRTA